MMRSGHPALSDKAFAPVEGAIVGETMTLQGTVNKTFIMLGLLVASAAYVWSKVPPPEAIPLIGGVNPLNAVTPVGPLMAIGGIGGFIVAMITIFKKSWAGRTAPVYALLEGLLIGGLSAILEQQYPGIVVQAVGLTFGTLFCLLAIYKTGVIRVTHNFRLGILAATGAIFLVYVVNFVMGFFNYHIAAIHSSGTVGIIFSLVVVGIAAMNLILDFDFIERASERSLPKYMEWYAAFGLMVTLVWLYIEILRLLGKMNRR